MSDRYTSLFDALNVSLKKIIDHYSDNWVFTGHKNQTSADRAVEQINTGESFHTVFEAHNHNFMEICICLSGSFAMQIDDYIKELDIGRVCLILPGAVHSELAKKNCTYEAVWITLYYNTIAIHLSGRNDESGLFYTTDGCSMKSQFDCSIFVDKIKDEVMEKALYFYDAVKTNVIQILLLALRMLYEQGDHRKENIPWKESVVLQVCQYIEQNCSDTIRLSDVSQQLCISPNYLNTIFKSVTGKTIIQHMEEYRIEKAKKLLKNSTCSIHEISDLLGYYDQYHFSKIFKKATGNSPMQYRKSYIVHKEE